jgi:hypothetical protein
VTTVTACPVVDLQVNLITNEADAYVWLKLGDETDVGDLYYSLWNGGNEEYSWQTFDEEDDCGKYTLAYPDFPSLWDGTWTMEVYYGDESNFSSDSFRFRD